MKKLFFCCVLAIAARTELSAQTKVDEPAIFKVVEQMPEFPGGEQALYKYIADNVHYTDTAEKARIEGVVRVKFVVNEDGNISNTSVQKLLGYGLDEEAMRVVGAMPKWKPGRNNGVNVKVYFVIPIKFVLTDDAEKEKK